MLKTRILTALILIPLVLWLLLQAPNAYLMPVILICVAISSWEMAVVFSKRRTFHADNPNSVAAVENSLVPVLGSWAIQVRCFGILEPILATILASSSFLLLNLFPAQQGLPFFALLYVLYGAWHLLSSQDVEQAVFRYLSASFLLIYCVLPWTTLWRLQGLGNSGFYILFTLIVVFFGDTGGYFGGRYFGKTKLAPLLSPNKTVEGAITGLFASLLGAVLLNEICDHYFGHPFLVAFIALVGGVLAQLGDLCESGLKRFCGAKDSGGIFPGHGGLLDRVDGVLFAAPWFWICFYLMTS